jgi:hypothetical protein
MTQSILCILANVRFLLAIIRVMLSDEKEKKKKKYVY